MPDWRRLIRERLGPLGLAPTREAAILEELAADLSDRYEELRARGVAPEAAERQLCDEQLTSDALTQALAEIEEPAAPPPTVPGTTSPDGMLRGVLADTKYAARSLRKNPGLTAVALLTLAIGIGANTAIFSVVNAVLLRPPPFEQPERLVTFWGTAPEKALPVVNYPDVLFEYYRQRLRAVSPMAMYAQAGFTHTGGDAATRLVGANVTADFFTLLGVEPQLGRGFHPDESRPGRNLVTVLSYGLWQRQFGGDPSVLGRSLMLNDIATTVVGVMPPGFSFPNRSELWVPLAIDPSSMDCWCYAALGRLAPGQQPDDLAREVDRLNADFWAEREGRPRPSPGPDTERRTVVRPLAGELVGEVRAPVLLLSGAVGLVLLIACANLASLLLARAAARRREMAVRAALGASPRRLMRQLLAESLLVSLTGALLGVGLAWAALGGLSRLAMTRVTWLESITLDGRVLLFGLGLGLLTGVLFGFAPAFRGGRVDLTHSLKEGSRGSGEPSTRRLNDGFVIAQLGLSLVLLIAAGLLVRSFNNLLSVDPGFKADHTLVGRVAVPWTRYREMREVRLIADRLTERLALLPGVTSVGVTSTAPFSSGDNQQNMLVRGRIPGPDEPIPVASVRRVSPGYFEAVGTRLIAGRAFTPADRDSTELVAIIDETVARRYWPDRSAVGERIGTGDRENPRWRTVVGVVASVRHQNLAKPPDHYVYYPLAQSNTWTLDLVVRSSTADPGLGEAVRREVSSIDPDLPFYDVHTLEEAVSRSVGTRRFTQLMLTGFAACALLLAAIGVYGLMTRAVTARIREFGVRLALGARPGQIEALVLRQGIRLVLIGTALGVVGAFGATRLLRALLFEVNPADPVTFAVAALVLGAVALAACWVPARRATGADPLEALRAE